MDQAIRQILADVGNLSRPADKLGFSEDLFAAGLTSFATVAVMLAIEERFDVEFPDAALTRASFANIGALSDVVGRLRTNALC
jgi:acyl carrier protein